MNEIWKPIPDYEGIYECSNMGKIKSLKRKGKLETHILNERKDTLGYQSVLLCKNGKMKSFKVHRLVGFLFVDNPDNKPHINHKDGNKSNPIWLNLEWCTHSENHRHAYLTGLKEMPCTKLTKGQVLEIYNSNKDAKELSEIYNVVKRTIYQIKIGQTWKHITGGNHKPIKK